MIILEYGKQLITDVVDRIINKTMNMDLTWD